MKTQKRLYLIPVVIIVALSIIAGSLFLFLQYTSWGFARRIPLVEQLHRLDTVRTAAQWLGTQEGSGNHEEIVRIYNSHTPLAQGYAVTIDDNWCAAFASAVAIECGITHIVPTECGCQRQIGLWQTLGRWEENDNYMPLPGDYIYYAWDEGWDLGDCAGWADHVGIVVGTAGPFIKVIEGNKNDSVSYRIILRGNYQIRGYGLPDYNAK